MTKPARGHANGRDVGTPAAAQVEGRPGIGACAVDEHASTAHPKEVAADGDDAFDQSRAVIRRIEHVSLVRGNAPHSHCQFSLD
jgi:hypothetical protein